MEMKTILSLTLALTLAFSPLLFSQKVVLYENFEAGIPDDWTNSPVSSGTPDSTQLASGNGRPTKAYRVVTFGWIFTTFDHLQPKMDF
jgi:hypothetical protein